MLSDNFIMKISKDQILTPQPLCLKKIPESPELDARNELAFNKKRLRESKDEVKIIKEKISKLIHVLVKEVGEDVDLKDLLRKGDAPGWLSRAQMIMNLKLKLTALRSQFLGPAHKMYYRGPFDPKKELHLSCLPEKQENLFQRLLDEKRKKILQHSKPVEFLKQELDDLKLMHKAARFRNKSLVSKVGDNSCRLEKVKEKVAADLHIVESVMAHQSLYKAMIDFKTFELDPDLKKLAPEKLTNLPEGVKFKKMLGKVEKELEMFHEATLALAQKLDKISKDLIEAEQLNCENVMAIEKHAVAVLKDGVNGKLVPAKGENPAQEMQLLEQENRQFRLFLLNSVLSTEEDLKQFLSLNDICRNQFVHLFTNYMNKMLEC